MKKTDTFTKIAATIIFLAAVGYLVFGLINSTRVSVVTAPVVAATVSDSARASGITIRDETLLFTDKPYFSVQAEDGKSISKGGTLALAVDSESTLDRLNHIQELKLEIASLESAIENTYSSTDISNKTESILSAIITLEQSVSRKNTSVIEAASENLSSLIFENDSSTNSQERLDSLKQELETYSNAEYNASVISADYSGIFSRNTDGYEPITPAKLENLTITRLNSLMDSKQVIPSNVYGKLITSSKWYFAASIDAEHATRLTVGNTVYLDFSRYYKEKIPATVNYISAQENGQCAVVFSTKKALSETLSMRIVSADIVFSEVEGLRIPLKAAHVDESGKTFVYCVTAQRVEKKYITITDTQDEYYLVKVDNTADALREGNTIIVSGKNLFEGKVID